MYFLPKIMMGGGIKFLNYIFSQKTLNHDTPLLYAVYVNAFLYGLYIWAQK